MCPPSLPTAAAPRQPSALAHRAQALAALASGSRREAIPHYETALLLYARSGDEVERGRVLRSMIDALMHLGRHDEALAAAGEAREIFRRHRLPVLEAQVEANVGSVFHLLDRNLESLDAYERALRVFRARGGGRGGCDDGVHRATSSPI